MNTVTTKDGIQIFYKDWGAGAAHSFLTRMATERRRLGRPDDVLPEPRLPCHRA